MHPGRGQDQHGLVAALAPILLANHHYVFEVHSMMRNQMELMAAALNDGRTGVVEKCYLLGARWSLFTAEFVDYAIKKTTH
jgi:hypothetical protein